MLSVLFSARWRQCEQERSAVGWHVGPVGVVVTWVYGRQAFRLFGASSFRPFLRALLFLSVAIIESYISVSPLPNFEQKHSRVEPIEHQQRQRDS